jgi:hypothetical protein
MPYNYLPVFMNTLQQVNKNNEKCKVTSVCQCTELWPSTVQPLRYISLNNDVWANTVHSSCPLYPFPLLFHTWRPETGFYSLLVCILKDQNSLHSASASFSMSCFVTSEDRPGVPMLTSCVCYIYVALKTIMFSKLLKYTKFSYHEVNQAIWLASVQPHCSGTLCK